MMIENSDPHESAFVEDYVRSVVNEGTELLIPDSDLEDRLERVKTLALAGLPTSDECAELNPLAWSETNGSAPYTAPDMGPQLSPAAPPRALTLVLYLLLPLRARIRRGEA